MTAAPAERAEPRIVRAVLIVEGDDGKAAYPYTAEHLAELGPEGVAEAMAWIVRQRSDAIQIGLRLECEDRTTTWGWGPPEATAEHFTAALRAPSALAPAGTQQLTGRRYTHGRWTLIVHKEVGPPRWWWPHIGIWPRRGRVAALVGWNFTAYHAGLSWKRDT